MKRFVLYVAGCVGAVGGALVLVWALHGFVGPGLPPVELLAMAGGMTLTVALAVGLMALMFYSNRSGYDETIYHGDFTERHGDETPPSRHA